ncbi:CocE/NonD family hydrolase, partial [Streptococcus sp. DD11]|uniref:CocE/NonD family hydrolase n=1 Tax=Streptococcus sp. DD11 TaxID=1777879 RepID=UPI002407A658
MKKKKWLSFMLPSLLAAPFILSQAVQADEVLQADSSSAEQTAVSPAAISDQSIQPAVLTVESREAAADSAVSAAQESSQVDGGGTAEDRTASSGELSQGQDRSGADANAAPTALLTAATGQELAAYTGRLADASLSDKSLTVQDAVDELLKWAAVSDSQLGSSAQDRISFAKSLGMIGQETDAASSVPAADLQSMYALAKQLYDAYRAEKKAPLFLNGRAQPIFPYSSGQKEDSDYAYEDSEIVRFPVYVETDYDTDGDGQRDLVKAIVQLPKAAANGDFKASTILEARPYVAGTLDESYVTLESLGLPTNGSYDMKQLRSQPAKRQPVSAMTTVEAAKRAKASDWYYYSPYEGIYDYEDLNWYDYFLVRGYAFISSAGLGTRGSEGFNTTGSDLEIAAFKNIIEWVNGQRTAYTDKTGNIEIKADWANGKVAMTGLSWAGTTTFGVAATGVEGLKT